MLYTDEEILNILSTSKRIKDAAERLGIKTEHRNGTAVIKELEFYGNCVGFDINILRTMGNKKERFERNKKEYLKNPRLCPVCGNIIPFEKPYNKTCSQNCGAVISNSNRKQTEETKRKISLSLNGRTLETNYSLYSNNPIKTIKNFILHSQDRDTEKYDKIKFILTCKECGRAYLAYTINSKNNRLWHSQFCSKECKRKNASREGKLMYERLCKEGKFIGWKTRNISSYAEKFWKEVLDNNNISYIKEYFLDKKYFLDFYIEVGNVKIDLEIDGKQHEYQDRKLHDLERDKYIYDKGIIVYRIKWNSINSTEGKNLMRDKIDAFLNFYNSL